MKSTAGQNSEVAPESVIQKSKAAFERLSAEAERLKKISELQSLRANDVKVSVDTRGFLDVTKNAHGGSSGFATLQEMIHLLFLMAANSERDADSGSAS